MKVCHIADIHWRGLKRHSEYVDVFTRLLNDAKSKKVDRIVVAGDIVHTKTMGISPEIIKHLTWWFGELANTAKTIVTLGNHDGLILNKSRLDTITPIVQMLGDDRIVFLRDSMQWDDDEFNVTWTNFSCFDEANWQNLKPISNRINIALFHGAIKRAVTDIGWQIDGDCDMSLFDGFDFGMFGDIHKCQYLDEENRFAYPGSTIQQDFSEDIEKGYLFWNIESAKKYSSKRVIISSPNPFYTVEWDGTVSLTFEACKNLKKGCRLRISSNKVIHQDEVKSFTSLVKSHLNPEELVWKITEENVSKNILIGNSNVEKSSLRDDTFHKNALRDYYSDKKLTDEEWTTTDSVISNIVHSFENLDRNRNSKWSIRNIEWDNTFSYGEGNKIDFSSLDGVIGLFGTNRCGKSSIPGTIMYALFNDTDRGSISNFHVINARKNSCEARVEFELDGSFYRVERLSTKWNNAKGDSGAVTKMNLFKVDESGEILDDISEEQRSASDKILRELIGDSSDFLLTSFASQGEMNAFIKNGATDRKKLLNNFLDLGIFELIERKLKDESQDIKLFLKTSSKIDFDDSIRKCNDNIELLQAQRQVFEQKIKESKSKEISLRINLATVKSGEGYTRTDVEEKELQKAAMLKEIEENDSKIESLDEKIEKTNEKVGKITTLKTSFPIDNLRSELSRLNQLELAEAKIAAELQREIDQLEQKKRSIAKLNEVPCGDQFPTCKFIKDSHRDKALIETQRDTIETLTEKLNAANSEILDIKARSLEEKIKKYESILREEISLNASVQTYDVERKSIASKNRDMLLKVNEIETAISEMKRNMVSDDISEIVSRIESELSDTVKDLNLYESNLLSVERNIGSETSMLQKNESDKKEYEKKARLWKIYELLINAYGKNGLPQSILSQKLPMINNEIASILQGVCGFTVVLMQNGNSLDINIDYGDSQRPIELGSGMEKMMASLAIRVALINVSSLPKTDMLIIDEGFGALDEVNVEACNSLLVSLKRFFKTIIVISHVDAVKDAVDNIIEISKNGSDSFVWA